MFLGGFYYKDFERVQLQPVKSPTELDLRELLIVLKNESGILALEQKSLNDFGPNELTLYSENGNYLVPVQKQAFWNILTILATMKFWPCTVSWALYLDRLNLDHFAQLISFFTQHKSASCWCAVSQQYSCGRYGVVYCCKRTHRIML